MSAALESPPRGWRLWWLAIRPRTLPVGAAPVLVGTAVAAHLGAARAGPAAAALAGALLLQVASNLANDVYDHERGADTEERLGPTRVTQQGWISPAAVKRAMGACLGAAAGVGLYLVGVGGWPVAAIGLAGMWAAWAYTGGPFPLGYHGLGDLAVFVFFGLAAVSGSAYVQTGSWSGQAFWASLPVGALATAVLVVNNLRDVEQDRAAGKRTLAVRLGPRAARAEYALLVGTAYAAPTLAWGLGLAPGRSLLCLGSLVLAVPLLRDVLGRARGVALNESLAGTARLLAVHAGLLALGFWP